MRPIREKSRKLESAYFVSTQTSGRQPLFRHQRWARLLETTILHYGATGFSLHAYVIMPDHLHLLITPKESLEKAVQLVKGGFSFRARKELASKFDIWQPGFSDHRIRDREDWGRHLDYIRRNPGSANLEDPYPYVAFPDPDFRQGLKPAGLIEQQNVRAEARTLQDQVHSVQDERAPVRIEV